MQIMKFTPDADMPFPCENSQSLHRHMGGGLSFYYTSHDMNRFILHVHRARLLNGFENGPNLVEYRIEYVLLKT